MAAYINPDAMYSRHSSIDHMSFGYDAYDNLNRPIVAADTDSMSRVRQDGDKINLFIIFIFILELLVLVFLGVLEYFLRMTAVFPIREMNFTCTDPSLSYTNAHGRMTFGNFEYNAEVSYEIIISLCFCVPAVIILLCELALWGFSEEPQKMVRALCPQCRLPQVLRRMVRYIGTFLFGLLITMVFVDVTKLFVGRLRPNFLSVCQPLNCPSDSSFSIRDCGEKDAWKLRQASMSFPSFHAAITAFAGLFTGVYIHNIIRATSVRIMRPFLSLGFVMVSVMCCLARYGLYHSHWTDVAVGFVLGGVIALYMCISVLHNFRERLTSNGLYQHIRDFMFEQRALELRELYKEERLPYASYPGTGVYAGGIILPRPHVHANGHVNETNTDDVDLVERAYHPYSTHSLPPATSQPQQPQPRKQVIKYPVASPQQQQHNTFQRDLHRSLDQYRHNDFSHM